MVSRRVIIGKYTDGVTFGMKVALPTYDALAEADDSPNLTFNSNWTNLALPRQLGFAVGPFPTVSISDPGYVPYAETRLFTGGNTIHDDDMLSGFGRVGCAATYGVTRSPLTLAFDLNSGETAIFVIFAVPVLVS